MYTRQLFAALTIALGISASTVLAFPVSVSHQDLVGSCDTLVVPTNVDELGVNGFPPNETITASDQGITTLACPTNANPSTQSTQVTITNLTGRSFTNLWYVADPETTFTNIDGQVNNEHAFKIDFVGLNKPLINESINFNGIFEPLEVWDFVIDDYFNTFGLPASQLDSVGLVGGGSIGDSISSASIIAMPIPEPAAWILFTPGLGLLSRRRRVSA